MPKPSGSVRIAQSFEVMQPPPGEQVLPVPLHEWERIMNRVEKCGDSSQVFDSIGWTCLGVGASALLAGVTFPFSVDFVRRDAAGNETVNLAGVLTVGFCFFLAVACLVAGAVSLLYARRHRTDRADRRADIVDDMRLTRDRFRLVSAPPPESS
jgi:hypothetical protein